MVKQKKVWVVQVAQAVVIFKERGYYRSAYLSPLLFVKNTSPFISLKPFRGPEELREMARRLSTSRGETSLDAAMRAPSTTPPDVVVLSFLDEDVKAKEISDPKKDLWLSSIDGYVSPFSGASACRAMLVISPC